MRMIDVEMNGLVFFLDFLMYCCHTTTECFADRRRDPQCMQKCIFDNF